MLTRYLKHARALVGQALIVRLIGMGANVVLARGLGTAQLGVYSAVMNTSSSAYGLVKLGTDAGIHVLTAETELPSKRLSRSDILVAGFLLLSLSGGIAALGCLVLAGFLANTVYGNADLTPWLAAASAIVFAQCLGQFFYAALAGLQEFRRYAVVSAVGAAVGLVLLLIGVSIGQLKGAVTAAVATQWLTTLGLAGAFMWGRALEFSGLRHLTQACMEILKLGVPFYLAGLLSIPVYYIAQGALAQSAGLEAVGYLRIIGAITSIVTFVPTSVAAATVSTLTSARTDPAVAREHFGYLALLNLRVVWMFALVGALFTYSLMPAIVQILFGDEYRSTVAPARVAVLTAALVTIVNAASHGYFAERRIGTIFWQIALQTAVFGLCAALLIPTYGVIGYVSADLVAYAAMCFAVVVISIQVCRSSGLSSSPVIVLSVLTFCSVSVLWHLAALASAHEIALQLLCWTMLASALYVCWKWGLQPDERERGREALRRLSAVLKRGPT